MREERAGGAVVTEVIEDSREGKGRTGATESKVGTLKAERDDLGVLVGVWERAEQVELLLWPVTCMCSSLLSVWVKLCLCREITVRIHMCLRDGGKQEWRHCPQSPAQLTVCLLCVREPAGLTPGKSLDCFAQPYDQQLRRISRIVAFCGEAWLQNRVG